MLHYPVGPDAPVADFREWYNRYIRPLAPAYDELYRTPPFALSRKADGSFHWTPNQSNFLRLSPMSQTITHMAFEDIRTAGRMAQAPKFIEHHVMTQMVGGGVKLFCPSVRECEVLEHTELNLPCSDYRQPFDALALEFPAGYQQQRVAEGTALDGQELPVWPIAAVSYLDLKNKSLLTLTCLQCGTILTNYLPLENGEDLLKDNVARIGTLSSPAVTPGERQVLDLTTTILLNASLLLTHYGHRRVGPLNPDSYSRLQRLLAKKKAAHYPRNLQELRAEPVIYSFTQDTVLYDEEESSSAEPGEATGRTVKPHWRNGYWRRQTGYREVLARGEIPRRLHVKGVLVNAHCFFGKLSDTTRSMRTKNG